MAVLLLILVVIGVVEGFNTTLQCDCTGFEDKTQRKEDSMNWLNMIADAWYQTSSGNIKKMLDGIIKEQVNTQLPKWIVSLKLAKFGFKEGNLPKFTRVKSSMRKVRCEGAVLRQYTVDMNVYYYSKQSIADVWLQLPLTSSLVSLNKIELSGTLRVQALMRSDLGLPGLASATVSFLGRPVLKVNVDLNNLVGLDTFGIDKWITSKIEDVALNQLVYPGALYLDLSKLSSQQAVETMIIAPADPDLHTALLSARVEITPNFKHTTDKQLTAEFHLKDQTIQIHTMTDNSVFQFNRFLNGFTDTSIPAQIRVLEKGTFSDTTFAVFNMDVPMMIKSDYLSGTFMGRHTKDSSTSWTITANISAYLLPQVPLYQRDQSVTTLNTLSGIANCANTAEKGVLFIHLHHAVSLTASDNGYSSGSTDPYVIVYLNGVEVGKTEYQSKTMAPVFNKKIELLLNLKEGDLVSKQKLRFEMWDHDKVTKDDKLGTFTINASKKRRTSMALPMQTGGTLYVSTTFRPVPFLSK